MTPEQRAELRETDAIAATHPLKTKRHDLYQEALRLVSERHAKGDLVELVNWLLARADEAESRRDSAVSGVSQLQSEQAHYTERAEKAEARVVALTSALTEALTTAIVALELGDDDYGHEMRWRDIKHTCEATGATDALTADPNAKGPR